MRWRKGIDLGWCEHDRALGEPIHELRLGEHAHGRRLLADRQTPSRDDDDYRGDGHRSSGRGREALRRPLRLELGVAQVVGALPVHEQALGADPDLLALVVLDVDREDARRPDHYMIDVARARSDRHGVQYTLRRTEPFQLPGDLELADRPRYHDRDSLDSGDRPNALASVERGGPSACSRRHSAMTDAAAGRPDNETAAAGEGSVTVSRLSGCAVDADRVTSTLRMSGGTRNPQLECARAESAHCANGVPRTGVADLMKSREAE
ncbi:hypothetical protein BJ978_001561 [Agromyces terreus]|uniref:Uncharacterized protein n=1 Tax=Agromyces terreus TaxID=424795 RepID=A0A9X2KC62_9MICO|nr:hypothetical protein [Agromyces terreus]MCP2370885.1 hypothetical protein [Agromyces terreus]